MQIDFAEVKVLQQQNMLNMHHMHTWVCTVFKWNYEQHLFTHTLIPIMNGFASTNEPLSPHSSIINPHVQCLFIKVPMVDEIHR